jgi:hypothetical protein
VTPLFEACPRAASETAGAAEDQRRKGTQIGPSARSPSRANIIRFWQIATSQSDFEENGHSPTSLMRQNAIAEFSVSFQGVACFMLTRPLNDSGAGQYNSSDEDDAMNLSTRRLYKAVWGRI